MFDRAEHEFVKALLEEIALLKQKNLELEEELFKQVIYWSRSRRGAQISLSIMEALLPKKDVTPNLKFPVPPN